MKNLFALLNQHFGRASMVAKFSLILNIILAHTVQEMRNNEDGLIDALILCHGSKYKDLSEMLVLMDLLKGKITSPEAKEDLNKIIEKGKNSIP